MQGWTLIAAGLLSPAWQEKRRPLTKVQHAFLWLYQEGRCGCGCSASLLGPERHIDEHLIPRHFGSEDRNLDALSNRRIFLAGCAAIKTARTDARDIAKVRRLQGKTGQAKRRADRGESSIKTRKNPWPPKGSRKLQSRPMRTK